jgi:hypothetical protein
MMQTIEKLLTANDCGETGTHQGGICVPKGIVKVAFFPHLAPADFNPRTTITMVDDAHGKWAFEFIYYNSRVHNRGTRNEYRLTWMTKFLRQFNLKPGDTLVFSRDDDHAYRIGFTRAGQTPLVAAAQPAGKVRLKLASGWKVIEGVF